jgi:hypothetical protein
MILVKGAVEVTLPEARSRPDPLDRAGTALLDTKSLSGFDLIQQGVDFLFSLEHRELQINVLA